MFYARLNQFRIRYRQQIYATIGVLVIAAFTIAQFVPDFTDVLVRRGVISLLTLLVALDISTSLAGFLVHRGPRISRDQDADTQPMLELLKNSRVDEADLIEYSATTADALLIELRRQNAKIRLLVKHPDSVSAHQSRRILQQIFALLNGRLRDYGKAEIRCYRAQASLRGRKIAPVAINLGWYTPDISGGLEILGDTNPLVTAPLNSPEGRDLARMFDGLFKALWNAADTEDAHQVQLRAFSREASPPRTPGM
jgi:hypothetical protein